MIDFRTAPLQEMFDYVVRELYKQGGPAVQFMKTNWDQDGSMKCAYRTDTGKRCAFGQLIPDELYCEEMEGNSATIVIDNYFPITTDDKENRMDFIVGMQCAHDRHKDDRIFCPEMSWKNTPEGVDGIAKRFIAVAYGFHLKPDVVYETFLRSAERAESVRV
jgi:hypothetical protein